MSTANSPPLISADFASFHPKTLIFAPKQSTVQWWKAPAKQPPFPRARCDLRLNPPLSRLGFHASPRPSAESRPEGIASVAEAVSSSAAVEERRESPETMTMMPTTTATKTAPVVRDERRGVSRNRYDVLRKRQVKIETEAWENAAKEYKELLAEMCRQRLAPNLPYMKTLFLGWFEPFRDAIEKEQEMCRKRTKMALSPFMVQLPAEMMAVITMHKLVGLLMSKEDHGTARVVSASIAIGDAIEQEVKIQRIVGKSKKKNDKGKENKEEVDTKIEDQLKKRVTEMMKQQKLRAVRQIVNAQDGSKPWGPVVKAKVGSRLIELLTETAYIQPPSNGQLVDYPPDVRPAFVHTTRSVMMRDAKKSGRKLGVIQCDPLVFKGLEKSANHMVMPYMPMLVPPVPWKGYDKGGHFFLPSYLMRTHGVKQQRDAVKRVPRNQLEPIFAALDSLGNTKWRVNKRVLNIIERIWATGDCIADLVDRSDVPLPEKPDTEDEILLKKWKMEVRSVKKENRERYSQRCDIELKLAVARKMKEEEGFYYPHNVDFRGRAYPMHPYLNHLGSDLCRGILEFAEGRPLGKPGMRWLKIHLANLYGGGVVDKLSHDGRVEFIESHLDEVFDSADRPLDGKRWWLNAEDPFQCLATCINLTDALRSPSPETFVSHIHVHQDGSCNGLQHYASLGRDKLGATAVNLVAGDKPADVYSGIADRVLEIMLKDANEDPEVNPDALEAKLLLNQVDRKLVKQTVMTSVYGVTYIGARDQIKKRLKERGVILDEQELFACSCYAAKITLAALGEMFEAARSIMSWLGECAKIISAQNKPVRWTTPLGLPVVQPYHKRGQRFIKTSLQILTVKQETEKVMARRQKTAFPPNFVHSLDGSHMMMTAIACKNVGITFAGVHDSYWTHACDVDEMSRILREKFVELYEAPILEDLLESFQQSFPELSFPPLPERGDFELKSVLESPYFFN